MKPPVMVTPNVPREASRTPRHPVDGAPARRGGFLVRAGLAGLLALDLSGAAALAQTPKPPKKKPAAVAKLVAPTPAAAAPEPAKPARGGGGGGPMLPGAGSKQPINIDAAKLDYFDKEQKMIYSGDVVAVQGDSTLKASVLTIFLQKSDPATPGAAPAAASGGTAGAPSSGSSVKSMEAQGPVTLISKDQIGTGDKATYNKDENKVTLVGNVTLTQGANVTQGDKLVYDMTSGLAQVFSGETNNHRVLSVFTPGSGGPDPAGAGKKDKPGGKAGASKSTASGHGTAPEDLDSQ